MRPILSLFAVLCAVPAQAHKPSFSTGEYGTAEQAWSIQDPNISTVLYHTVTCEQPVLWLRYEVDEPTEIFIQLGVPLIERLADYDPVLGVVHDQVTDGISTPFPVPDGLGVQLHERTAARTLFFEPFTQTQSWILVERKVFVPAGSGYIAAWDPKGQTGKLWVAVGEVEDFTEDDWDEAPSLLGNARFFHEEGSGPTNAPEEQMCALAAESCSSSTPSMGLWLAVLAGAALRRRQRV